MSLSPESRRKLRKRYDVSGDAHALTFSCFRRQPFLSRDRTRWWFVDALNLALGRHPVVLWAYVIMPEHVHLLVAPTSSEYSTSLFLKSIKQSVSRKAVHYLKTQSPESLEKLEDRQANGAVLYRFWMRGGGYDRNITEPHTVRQQIDYIHNNPIRRGLCATPTEWFWSSAGEWESPGTGPVEVARDTVPTVVDS